MTPVVGAIVVAGGLAWAAPAAPGHRGPTEGADSAPPEPEIPDLDRVRFRFPRIPRRIFAEVRVGGVYLPSAVTRLPTGVGTFFAAGAWGIAVARRVAAQGSHTLAVYRAGAVTLQGSEHDLGVAVEVVDGAVGERPARGFLELQGALAVIKRSWVEGTLFKLGGLWSTAMGLGVVFEHRLHPRVRLGWRLDGRYVWVFVSTQRQVRAGLRASFLPRAGHEISLGMVGYLVHRDRRQFGRRFPRVSSVAVAELKYAHLSRSGVGPVVRLRYTTSFRSGEAPVYEVRPESLTTSYADLWLGIQAAF